MPGTVVCTASTRRCRVYKAFPTRMPRAKWLPPYGFTGKVHDRRPRRRQVPHVVHEFLVRQQPQLRRGIPGAEPAEKLRYADRFDDPNLPGTMEVTVTFRQVSVGTELKWCRSGIPDMIPVEPAR